VKASSAAFTAIPFYLESGSILSNSEFFSSY